MRRLVSLFVVFLAMSLTGWSQISYYVDGTNGSDANNGSQATPWQTITHAITQASSGDAINVAAGTYQEYVNVTKTLTLTGASAATVVIEGPSTGAQSVFLNANDIVFQGFTVTRAGNTPAAWATNSNNTGLQIAQLKTGCTVQNCIFTGNRNAIYLNNTQSHLIQNNIVDFNRTGVQLVNNVSGCTFTGNTITNNWTLGVVVYYNPNTLPATTNLTFSDNNISGNWYSQIEVKTISNFPTGTSYDFSKNYFGVADPRLTTTPAGEPGYDVQIPVMYGGTATAPSMTVGELTGDAISLADYSPWLAAVPGSSPMTWGTNDDIQTAIATAAAGDIINISAGTYNETGQIIISKNLSLNGAGESATIITPTSNTGSSGDARGWLLVQSGIAFNLSNVTLDGSGKNVHQAIRSYGTGTIGDVTIQNIVFPGYAGMGIVAFNNLVVDDVAMSNIGRVGISVYGTSATDVQIHGLDYTGKGIGDWLDYAVEFGGGGIGTVDGATISGCLGVASTDGSNSAGILASTYYGAGTTATILNSIITNSTTGVSVGFGTSDASTVAVRGCHLQGNEYGISAIDGLVASVAAQGNYWGDNDGPCAPANHADCSNFGAKVSSNVNYQPWTGQTTVVPAATIPNATMDIGDDDVTEIELEYVAVPESGGTISISTYDTAPTGITPPVANVSKYIDISSDMPNGSFGMWITLTVTAGSATGNFLETPVDTADNRLAYFNETSGGWVLVNGFYSVMPASTGGVFDNASGSAAFTFFADHFTVFAFIGGSSASYYNTPASAYPLYIAKAPIAGLNDAANRTVYPNSTWSGGYPGRTDDWGFSGTQPVTVYVVPDNDASFSFGSVTLQWVNGMLGSSVAVNGSDGTYSGLFTGSNRTLNSEMLGTTNTIRIDATRMDVTNYGPTVPDEPIATGDFMVKLGFTLLKPGSTGIDVIGADFRRYVTAPASQQYVYVEPLGTSIKAYLGDVANSTDQSSGDGAIDQADLAIWSNSYWSGVPGFAGGLTNYKAKFDIGPTTDGTPFSLPVPDTKIEFEDLVIFSISYGLSASNALPKGGTDPGSLSLAIGDAVEFGNEIRIPVRMHAGTDDVRALKLRFDGIEGKFLGIEKGTLLQEREESIPVFALQNGSALAVDLAVMGADAKPLDGSGDLVWLRFDASTDVRFTDAEARNSLNRGIRVALNAATATGFALEQNYPNPFNPSTTISFTLESDATIELSVHNTLGQKVATIYHGTAFAGTQQATWNGTDDAGRALPSGVYIYRLSDGTTTLQRAMMLAK